MWTGSSSIVALHLRVNTVSPTLPLQLTGYVVNPSIEVLGTKLWRVVFARDFTSAEILNANNEVVVKKFALSS